MFLAQSVMDEQITISITVEQLLAWILVGLIAGLLASLFVRGRISLPGIILIGLLGAIVGGFLFFDVLEIAVTSPLNEGILIRWIDILVAFVGSILILAATSVFYWRRL